MDSLSGVTLAELDPQIRAVLNAEPERQRTTLEVIALENFIPCAILEAQGSVLTNKYAEGYPGQRYYGGYETVDVAEPFMIERAKQVFTGANFVNVRPRTGAQANAAALMATANVGDTTLGLSLAHGGHLTHGMKINFSDKNYHAAAYRASPETIRIEPEKVREAALHERPKVVITGWSAYPRHLDFQTFREIADEVGAVLWVDMAHSAGLVAAGLHLTPIPYADIVTTAIHKTLGGPRSGTILSSRGRQWDKEINSAVFPGQQGGPPMHAIATRAIAMRVAQTEEFRDRQCHTPEGARILTEHLKIGDTKGVGITPVTGSTDVHLVLVNLANSKLDDQQAEDLLHEVGIAVNHNTVPFDPRPPKVTFGLRINTPALTARGFDAKDFTEVADITGTTLVQGVSRASVDVDGLRARVKALTDVHPLYARLGG